MGCLSKLTPNVLSSQVLINPSQASPFSWMANSIIQIIDSTASAFKYSGGEWSLNTMSRWYNGTAISPDFAASTGNLGSFTVEFEGTSIAFVGTLPPRDFSQNAKVSIDGAPAYDISYPTIAPPIYMQWYKTPELPPGKHNITVGQINSTSLDLAFVELSVDTNIIGKTVFVDNDDPGIQYSVAWARNTDGLNSRTNNSAFPLGNTTHRCTTHDSIFTYNFEGTAISLYGVFGWDLLGSLTVSYSIDDSIPVSQTYTVDENTPEFKNNVGDVFNFPFFAQDGLPAQKHTLLVTVIPVGAQVFMFDYMTYTPSFSNLITAPGNSSTTSIASSASNGPTGSAAQASPMKRSTSSIGPVVGGVVGGINLFLLIGFLLFWMRRRRRATQALESDSYPRNGSTGYDDAGDVKLTPGPRTPQLSPLRPGFVQTNAPIRPSHSTDLFKVPSLLQQNDLHATSGENSVDDLARRERLFNFGPRPTPVRTENDPETRAMPSDGAGYDQKASLSPRQPNATLAPAPVLPLSSGSSSASLIYPTPSQTPAPPAYDTLSTHRPSTRRPPTYRRTHIPDSVET